MKNTFVVVLLGSVLLLAITSHHPRPAPADTGRKGGKADGNALYVIGTAGKEFWATGDWSWTGQGKNGEPIPIKGYW